MREQRPLPAATAAVAVASRSADSRLWTRDSSADARANMDPRARAQTNEPTPRPLTSAWPNGRLSPDGGFARGQRQTFPSAQAH